MISIINKWKREENYSSYNNIEFPQLKVISLEDDGYLPDTVYSPFRYYIQVNSDQIKTDGPLFADHLKVPELWEIIMNYEGAEVWDEGVQKAAIEYAAPREYCNVKSVRWMMLDKTVYKIDHYDKYGKLYYDEILDEKGNVNIRTYYAECKPVIVCQPKRDLYTLMNQGKIVRLFASEYEFLVHFIEDVFSEEEIVSADEELARQVSAAGLPCRFVDRFEISFPSNLCGKEAYILTHSDQVEQLEYLITALPQMHFHIAAITLMSDKLLNLERYSNVSLYQGAGEQKRKELLQRSTYYLDINHYQEICDAIYEAYRHNLLIIGFDNTVHNSAYVLQQCVFSSKEPDQMVRFIEETFTNREYLMDLVMDQEKLPLKEYMI